MMNGILPVLAVPAIGMVIGYLLGFAALYFKVDKDPRIDAVAALLPNGQCGQCGFPGCMQAAAAMVRGEAPAGACTPGGARPWRNASPSCWIFPLTMPMTTGQAWL
ncbi:RnfABCDGE type electron transport complex subunit B [Acerihabitans sp. KWT182]|uniref:RnfABCDGE type electron transport complex subunit B n=1 Tax=Acerihabitans sp. KWT182 TaxID=3157919 RepID=A0AAU7Q5I4_9GAMM